jgi:hypothetical protein
LPIIDPWAMIGFGDTDAATSRAGRGERADMTDSADTTLAEALDLVDTRLSELQSREIISATQVADMLLDLRLLLMQLGTTSEPVLAP